MAVLPRTQLGYTLGVRRDKDVYGRGERPQKNPFAESRGSTRMAGDIRVNLYSAKQDELPEFFSNLRLDEEGKLLRDENTGGFVRSNKSRLYAKGDYVPTRFAKNIPVGDDLAMPYQFTQTLGIPFEKDEEEDV
tara:strand:+ start:79 stop:480 length:402 start_codon:yes stop_codon:yes gene_type:complete